MPRFPRGAYCLPFTSNRAASSGPGTPYHMAGELFKAMAGLDIVHVPYKESSGARTGVLGGQVEVQRGDRDPAGGDRGEIGPRLAVVVGRLAVDAEQPAASATSRTFNDLNPLDAIMPRAISRIWSRLRFFF